MLKQKGYNGGSKKPVFYKVKKHVDILARRAGFTKEVNTLRNLGNATLIQVLEAYLQVKEANFSEEELLAFARQESFRASLLENKTMISYEIFGSDKKVSVQQICERSPSPKIWAQFLYCLTNKLASRNFLEIGTNLGISGGYILEALKKQESSFFLSLEGLPQLCDLSREHFQSISSNVEVLQGLYDDSFPQVLNREEKFDTFFIDGNHQKEPTISYFQDLKGKANYPAVFVFDDINHSQSMQEAWDEIKQDSTISFSVDLFKMGIVILEETKTAPRKDFTFHLAY